MIQPDFDEKQPDSISTSQSMPEPEIHKPAIIILAEAKKPVVTYSILGITVAFFVLQLVSQLVLNADYPAGVGAKINDAILTGQIWRLLTPVVLHGGLTHIFFNMYALLVIGRSMEMYYGHRRYLALYLVAAFAGNVLSFVFTPEASYGASTAIFGLIAAEGIFIYRNRKLIPESRNMLINTLIVIGINLFIVGRIPYIDNFGHLGGLFGGGLFAWFAGPVWGVRRGPDEIMIFDSRHKSRTLPVILGVCMLFALIAAAKFILFNTSA